jgi:hypothetical protein
MKTLSLAPAVAESAAIPPPAGLIPRLFAIRQAPIRVGGERRRARTGRRQGENQYCQTFPEHALSPYNRVNLNQMSAKEQRRPPTYPS